MLFLAAAISGCSRKKNTFINRNWHAVTAEYNTLYNGNLALQLGIDELQQSYVDNYWTILPVERLHVSEEVMAPGENQNPNFAVAEEKAVKAIQRHSMLIDEREKNPQIDEAYLLLGQARYYDQRFVPALEAFNYILHKYPLGNTINEAKIWREKTNMRLEFNELAIKNLKKILENEKLEEENRAEALATLGQAYMNISSPDSAVTQIKKAAELTDIKKDKGRYYFITGQLYNLLEKKDSANWAFQEVIELKRRSPRIYLINAHLAQINNMEVSPAEKAVMLARLNDLAEDRENRPYLDKVYFQLAEFHYSMDSLDLAVDYYNRSLKAPSNDLYLQSLDYETLGNINFDAALFEVAGAYYDSTLQKLDPNTREYRKIKRKRDNLDDVIYYENLARSTDSILRLSAMSEEEQIAFFNSYTEDLKTKILEQTEAGSEENVAENYFEKKRTGMPGMPTPGSTFYFYNPTTVAYGKQEFFRVWGNRELTDNWRTGGGSGLATVTDTTGAGGFSEDDPRFDPQTYIARIPKDPAAIDSISSDLNFANYQLGLIYREKFGENQLAAEKLEMVLANDPEERLLIPAKYNLYKIYSEMGELARAQSLKNDIIAQAPDSRYAAILQNPESLLEDENNPTTLYQEIYKLFEKQRYSEVIVQSNELGRKYAGDEIVPKLELLKAMAKGRLYGVEGYKESLNFVSLNYPQTEEGKKAQEILNVSIPAMPSNEFTPDSLANSFKLVFPFEVSARENALEFENRLEEIIEELDYTQLKVSFDVYDPEQVFVVVHGFSSRGRTEGFKELLSVNKKYLIKQNSFYITTPNYRIIQIHKNLENYLTPQTPHY
ncbi:type IX secretion system periplasmic lipoprotein PorW/SprE [Salinimicrobium gaetbulicola]|uniref:Protein involved in gliding motility SprE n=1 Tax=Salinimicrobium gaetbulicola TaxID=999702 RepID=A0ABW3IH91_9FLAO